MSYHLVGNADSTNVELMPFSALEDDDQEIIIQAEDYAYRQNHVQSISLWNSFSNNPSSDVQTSSSWRQDIISEECTRRWHLLSKRRQKGLQIVLVFTGVLLIVTVLEWGVKAIYHNHVKPQSPSIADNDLFMKDDDDADDAAWQEQDKEQDYYDIPVNRVLCEQVTPLFKILDEGLEHYCFQRNPFICNGEIVYERDGDLYHADWDGSELLPSDAFSLESCQPKEPEIWSPLAPFDPSYDRVCQGIANNNAEAPTGIMTNRFCKTDDTVDWIQVKEMLPKCLLKTAATTSTSNHDESCNDLSWTIFQDVMGGHLNCWEFEIAYRYIESQLLHPGEDGTEIMDRGNDVCNKRH